MFYPGCQLGPESGAGEAQKLINHISAHQSYDESRENTFKLLRDIQNTTVLKNKTKLTAGPRRNGCCNLMAQYVLCVSHLIVLKYPVSSSPYLFNEPIRKIHYFLSLIPVF